MAPVEVETAILSHPAVKEVGVVGLPDPSWGEIVCAAIVVNPGAALSKVQALHNSSSITMAASSSSFAATSASRAR